MNMDWREALRGLDLPAGEDSPAEATEARQTTQRKKPKVVITYERKGRGGKEATILSGFDCTDAELLDLASQLKRKLACGGSARGGEILVQGDRREAVRRLLREMGYTTN